MQFKYMGDAGTLSTNPKMLEQFEIWTLNGLIQIAKQDLQVAAELFGTSVETLLSRLEKYGLTKELKDEV